MSPLTRWPGRHVSPLTKWPGSHVSPLTKWSGRHVSPLTEWPGRDVSRAHVLTDDLQVDVPDVWQRENIRVVPLPILREQLTTQTQTRWSFTKGRLCHLVLLSF